MRREPPKVPYLKIALVSIPLGVLVFVVGEFLHLRWYAMNGYGTAIIASMTGLGALAGLVFVYVYKARQRRDRMKGV